MFIVVGLMVSLVSFPVFCSQLKAKYTNGKSPTLHPEELIVQSSASLRPLRLDKSPISGTTQTTGDITKAQLYEDVYSFLNKGDSLLNSDNVRQAVDYYQIAFEKGKNSSLENICRSRLVVVYERINEDVLAL